MALSSTLRNARWSATGIRGDRKLRALGDELDANARAVRQAIRGRERAQDLDEVGVLWRGRRRLGLRNGRADEAFGELDLAREIGEVLGVGQLAPASRLLDQVRVDADDRERRAQVVKELGLAVARRAARGRGRPVHEDGGGLGRSLRRLVRGSRGARPRDLQRDQERRGRQRHADQREEVRTARGRQIAQRDQRGDAKDRADREEARGGLSLAVPGQRRARREQQGIGRQGAAGQRHGAEEQPEIHQHRQRRRERRPANRGCRGASARRARRARRPSREPAGARPPARGRWRRG